jgi:hypothetical protein
MLRTIENLSSYQIAANDGELGRLADFYFDDEKWAVRYLVVDTGTWLPRKHVLISPISLSDIDWHNRHIRVGLTKQQIKNSPDADCAKPISRRYETEFNAYYGYPYYWSTSGVWPGALYPSQLARGPAADRVRAPEERQTQLEESHLRSVHEVKGYHIAAADGDAGHVDDFVVDDQSWEIPYFVVDTSNWPGGRAVLMPTDIITDISWHPSLVHVSATREDIREARVFDRAALKRLANDNGKARRRDRTRSASERTSRAR